MRSFHPSLDPLSSHSQHEAFELHADAFAVELLLFKLGVDEVISPQSRSTEIPQSQHGDFELHADAPCF